MTTRPTLRQRGVARAIAALGAVACRLPERLAVALAQGGGLALYLARRERRDVVRHNLRRICRWLVHEGRATPRVAAAARDGRALERLVRQASAHYARSYLEVLRAPALGPADLADRLRLEQPERVDEAFARIAAGRGLIFMGLHFGSMELPALYATNRTDRPVTGPMETLGNPAVQAYLASRRGWSGVHIVDAASSGRLLRDALLRGEVVAIVVDRDVLGTGRLVSLFGAPARLPIGAAVLAAHSGAPTYVAAVRREGRGYVATVEELQPPAEGPFRERVAAFIEAQARSIERLVSVAPEQWWATQFPIWERPGEEPAA